jgi:hypothetical protein
VKRNMQKSCWVFLNASLLLHSWNALRVSCSGLFWKKMTVLIDNSLMILSCNKKSSDMAESTTGGRSDFYMFALSRFI